MLCCLVLYCSVLYSLHRNTHIINCKQSRNTYETCTYMLSFHLMAECSASGAQPSGRCAQSSTSIELNWTAPSPRTASLCTTQCSSTARATALRSAPARTPRLMLSRPRAVRAIHVRRQCDHWLRGLHWPVAQAHSRMSAQPPTVCSP